MYYVLQERNMELVSFFSDEVKKDIEYLEISKE
jgi:hypothetical protein